jgi:putative SOS response-associated peptidase YedK
MVLATEDAHAWLDSQLRASSQVVEIFSRSAGVPLDSYPVPQMVNKALVEGQALIQPVE